MQLRQKEVFIRDLFGSKDSLMKRKIHFGSLLLFLITISCSQNKEQEKESSLNFIGTYVFSLSPLQDSLFIENDSTYRHKYWASRNDQYEAKGKWVYDSKGEEILFKKFVFFNDEGPSTPAGNWYSKIRVSSEGNIDLMYSRENNIFYRKITFLDSETD